MGGQQSTINKLAMIRMGFMTHTEIQKVRFMSTEFQYLRNKCAKILMFARIFSGKSGFQGPRAAGFSGVTEPEKQKGTPLEKGALVVFFMIFGSAP